MPAPIDITGQTFGLLEVLEYTREIYSGSRLWKCRCAACGGETYARASDLRNGKKQTCGKIECKAKLKKKNLPRVDCIMYGENDLCTGLIEMMCVTRGHCKFFKPRED